MLQCAQLVTLSLPQDKILFPLDCRLCGKNILFLALIYIVIYYLKRHSSRVNCNEGHEGEAECDEADLVHSLGFALVLVHHQESSLP